MDKINYDVLIPARDEENNIKKTLECITNQTIKPNSIIVINDNSKDEKYFQLSLELKLKLLQKLECKHKLE